MANVSICYKRWYGRVGQQERQGQSVAVALTDAEYEPGLWPEQLPAPSSPHAQIHKIIEN